MASSQGIVFWITGLSGAGKTTVGNKVYEHIIKIKPNIVRLDGDMLREVFQNKDYSPEGRKRLGYQYARLCKMLSDQGMDVVISAIVMFDEIRSWNRENIRYYKEVFLDVSMEELMKRNQKGIYTQAKSDKKQQVYGVSIDAELPKTPDLVIYNYGEISPDMAFEMIRKEFNL